MSNPRMMWVRGLDRCGLSFKVAATYVDEDAGEEGVFCIFNTPRTVHEMRRKVAQLGEIAFSSFCVCYD